MLLFIIARQPRAQTTNGLPACRRGARRFVWLLLAGLAPALQGAGTIAVPNASFESPSVSNELFYAAPVIEAWEKTPAPPGYDTNVFGPWEEKTGVFYNHPSPVPLTGMDGVQGAFLFSAPGVGFFQDYDAIGGTNTVPTHAFDAVYQAGKCYRLELRVTTSSTYPVAEGATLLMRLYYQDTSSNRVSVGESVVTYSSNAFPDPYQFRDFDLRVPAVQPGDACAGRRIGIEFVSNVASNLIGGVWDLDHVRLTEFELLLLDPVWDENGQFQFSLVGRQGAVVEILKSPDVTSPLSLWPSLTTVTNTTGSLIFSDPVPGDAQGFYGARLVP
jgi:hypothetical protein